MFESQYYALVAGLKEYSLDSEAKGFDAKAIIEEVMEGVSAKDAQSIKLLYTYYDCENIISFRSGRTAHNPLGNLTREQIEDKDACSELLPSLLSQVLSSYGDGSADAAVPLEKALFGAYFEECALSSSKYLRIWAETDRNIRNISAAITARSKGIEVEDVVVGGGDVVDQITKSSAADFGLRGEFSYVDGLISAINDEPNILEKEHKIDLIRWDEATDMLSFDYFNLNMLLSYLVKVNIVARWAILDPKRGRDMFDAMVSGLSAKDMINK
ncbi:MAG: DUF2764 family protein [Rikenellaceae bacterium]